MRFVTSIYDVAISCIQSVNDECKYSKSNQHRKHARTSYLRASRVMAGLDSIVGVIDSRVDMSQFHQLVQRGPA